VPYGFDAFNFGFATRVGVINADGSGSKTFTDLTILKGLSWGR